jgi:hypothetical protein
MERVMATNDKANRISGNALDVSDKAEFAAVGYQLVSS